MFNILMMMAGTGAWLWLDCVLLASLASVSVIVIINIIAGCCGTFGRSLLSIFI